MGTVVQDAAAIVETARTALDQELEAVTVALHEAKIAMALACDALGRDDLLEAATQAARACDLEYQALGEAEHTSELAELIQRVHLGRDDWDFCGVEGCAICKVLTHGAAP